MRIKRDSASDRQAAPAALKTSIAIDSAQRTMLRVDEIAARWDLDLKTIYGMIQRGELAARRCGRILRVPRSVVESYEQASAAPDRS